MNRDEIKLGYTLALCSVLLVTLAQLLLKIGVIGLPPIQFNAPALDSLLSTPSLLPKLLLLLCGIVTYLGSLLCWLGALRHLPLHRAYPLLALSYGLVYLCAVILPWLQESFSLLKSTGVLFIILGVYLSQPVSNKATIQD